MAEFYKSSIPILDSSGGYGDAFVPPPGQAMGMTPRDYSVYPEEMFAPPSTLTVYDPSEWDALYDAQEEAQSSLEHAFLRGGGPAFTNLDQNGNGYCWAYSVGHAMMLDALLRGGEVPRLNPHATAAIIKGGRDEGGWCGLSAKWARETGYAVEGTGPGQWPLHSRNLKYDTPELRAAMATHRTAKDFYDLTRKEWDQKLTTKQVATCGFNNIPVPSDFNWWGHSVCQVRWVRIEPGSWGPLILNSWKGWGRYGLAVLRGSQAVANGAVAVLSTTA